MTNSTRSFERLPIQLLGMLGLILTTAGLCKGQSADWPMWGRDVTNNSNGVSSISPENVSLLKPKWVVDAGGDVSAKPAVVAGVVYFPDWGGNLWAVDADSGATIWRHQMSDYGVGTGTLARSTPAIVNGVLFIGTQRGGWLLAIQAADGSLIWKTQIESQDQYALVTASPAVANGVVYEGVASNQEGQASSFGFTCCTARGSVVAVDAATGVIKWKTYMVPPGYSGGGVWGSTPVVDTTLNSVFVATGNNYSNPTDRAYKECVEHGGGLDACQSPDNHEDSVVALDIATGAVKWAQRITQLSAGRDSFNDGCINLFTLQCPLFPGPDFDFGSGPNEITYKTEFLPRTILGAGQKSGVYSAFDPATGAILWQTHVGPGSAYGGMEWGSASDGTRIYVAISNFFDLPYAAGTAGSWAALDPTTGRILWQTADPNHAIDFGPVSVANGVVYGASMAGLSFQPTMFALEAATGRILWQFASGASVAAGPSIVGGMVFWGSGYSEIGLPFFTGNKRLYAFSVNGQ